MDPIAALGLASGILTFIDAGTKLIKTAYAIHNSHDGVLEDNRHREDIAGTVEDAASRLEITGILALTKEQQSLTDLTKRCQAISKELIQLLDKIKPKESSFKALNSLRPAAKAKKNKKIIGDLESRLRDYRDQLSLALIGISRVEAADGFSQLIFIAKNNEAKLKSLIQAVEHLRQGQHSVQGPCPPNELQQLLVVDTTARHSMYQDFILNCLKFQELHHRYEAIHTAHEDTFRWIYEPTEFMHQHTRRFDMQLKAHDKFINWLCSEVSVSPIFHISGKLGSGKSTLMKFLCSHQRTTEELIKWAAEVFPHQWKEAGQNPWNIQNRQEIPSREVQYALEKLLQDSRLYQHHKFCIFIDGLDEFEPGLQDGLDYVDLVGVLRRWASNANGNLKLCLSSREEPVFLDGFADALSFRLQDLTRFDMQNYVRSRLSNLADNDLKNQMTFEIQKRSSGIFLWIYLVVRKIRDKMTHKATSETLRKYLDTLPQDLESLFHHILQQLEPDDKRKTLQLISCLQVAKSYDLELPLIAFSFLDEYNRDPNFSLRDGLEDETLPHMSVLQAQLRGASGGLLESCTGMGEQVVMEFVHRSVPDIFHKDARNPDLNREMDMALRGIVGIDLMSHLGFAAVRLSISDPESQVNHDMLKRIRALVIAEARLIHGIDKPPYQFLEFIESWTEMVSIEADSKVWLDMLEPSIFYMANSGRKRRYDYLLNPQYRAASSDGGYIDWKISNDPSTLNNPVKRAMVGHLLLMSKNWEMFFRYSISTQNTTIPLLPGNPGFDFDLWLLHNKLSLTVWQLFLINLTLTGFSSFEAPVDIISRFLREGADPYYRILITKDGLKQTVTFYFRQAEYLQYRLYPYGFTEFKNGIDRCLALRGSPEIDWLKGFKEKTSQEISLREWVAASDWNNRDSLLELLDCSYEEGRDS